MHQKLLLSIAAGPAYKHGRTWHRELQDKPEPVATHCHWAIRNCQGNPENLRAGLTTVMYHYQNVHNHCHPTSRCRVDLWPIVPSITLPCCHRTSCKMCWSGPLCIKIQKPHSTQFQQHHEYFSRKEDAFRDTQYLLRVNLAILHWNENVGRDFTSVWNPADPQRPRRQRGKKDYTRLQNQCRRALWDRYSEWVSDSKV